MGKAETKSWIALMSVPGREKVLLDIKTTICPLIRSGHPVTTPTTWLPGIIRPSIGECAVLISKRLTSVRVRNEAFRWIQSVSRIFRMLLIDCDSFHYRKRKKVSLLSKSMRLIVVGREL
jgi:hypothetical protein